MAEINIRSRRSGQNFYSLDAKLEDGCLLLSGQDIGPVAEDVWGGDSDYEYWYRFDAENTGKLFQHILGEEAASASDEALLNSFRDWMGAAETEEKLTDACREGGIHYEFFSY